MANGGLRINQDPDFSTGPVGASTLEGETSVQAGGAFIFTLTQKLSGIVEAAFETERIDASGSDLRWTLGGEYRYNESFRARLGAGVGTGGSASDFELIASAVLLF